jgi:hypothetical protein
MHKIRNAPQPPLSPSHSSESLPLFVPVSHSPWLSSPFPFLVWAVFPFPSRLRNHFPPIRSVLGETKIIIYSNPKLCFFCLMVVIRDKNYLGIMWICVYLLGILLLIGLLLGIFSEGKWCCTAASNFVLLCVVISCNFHHRLNWLTIDWSCLTMLYFCVL